MRQGNVCMPKTAGVVQCIMKTQSHTKQSTSYADHLKHTNTHVIIKIFKGTLHISMASVIYFFNFHFIYNMFAIMLFFKKKGILSENQSSLYNAVLLLDLFHLCIYFTRK